ncbi:sensor histidine kinase [Paenibacillus alba]|uniref:Histidine kinase n=1 Tax=Paenibacillus alba TaxID=1197127 RepID=A0ABU6G428_9BACL|nr:histidine kinase [Paenibacillus alba]MEC0228705.1 histidine kinase [Paenibacillus alba]
MSKVNQYLSVTFSSFQNILFSIDSTFIPDRDSMATLKPNLQKLVELNQDFVTNVYVIKQDMSIIGGSRLSVAFDEPREERRALYEQALNTEFSTVISKPYMSSSSGWTVTLLKYLHGSQPKVVIALDIDLQAMNQNLLKITRDDLANLFIMDQQGQLIAGEGIGYNPLPGENHSLSFGNMTSKQLAASAEPTIRSKDHAGKPITLSKMPNSKFNWLIVSLNTGVRLENAELKLQRYSAYLIVIGVLLSALVASAITRYIRSPLLYLMNKMKLIRLGHLDVNITWSRKDEFGQLAQTFDLMIQQIRGLLDNLNASNELKRELEIQVLQSQINPHFLYNTLGCISNVVGLEQYDKVDPMIRALISTLEYGIAEASEKVTLQEELNNVRDYIFIQNIRYNQKVIVQEFIENGLEQFPVFRLLLQPIVENSLFHGYSGGRKSGLIIIKAYTQGEQILIDVIDEGVGMSASTASSLLQRGSVKTKGSRKRIGLANIHQRIKLYYGESYGLTIVSNEGNGTCVRAVFPWLSSGKEEE